MGGNKIIEKMRKDGYPYKIVGMAAIKPLFPDYMAIYRYPGGECCHCLEEIKACFTVIEQ